MSYCGIDIHSYTLALQYGCHYNAKVLMQQHNGESLVSIDPFLGIFVAMVLMLEVLEAGQTKLSTLLQLVVQVRYNS